jgi:hypothetical protein
MERGICNRDYVVANLLNLGIATMRYLTLRIVLSDHVMLRAA